MIIRSFVIAVVLLSTAHADDAVEVPAAPPIATAPAAGLDPDVERRIVDAEALASRGDLGHALERALVLYQSDDPFSRAQRDLAKPRTRALLTQIGTRAQRTGDIVLAARALDARWILSDHAKDADLARTLVAWSERDDSLAESLYLARRARRADPDLVAAARRDAELSRNRRAWTGRFAILAGIASFGAGLYATHTGHDQLATGLYVATPVLCTGGMLVMLSGVPKHRPVSPAELPALDDR